MSKTALITGITGQDGSYLAEFLLEKGYEVHGIVRRASISNTARIDHLIAGNAVHLHDGDLYDSSGLIRLVGEIKPDEIGAFSVNEPYLWQMLCQIFFSKLDIFFNIG